MRKTLMFPGQVPKTKTQQGVIVEYRKIPKTNDCNSSRSYNKSKSKYRRIGPRTTEYGYRIVQLLNGFWKIAIGNKNLKFITGNLGHIKMIALDSIHGIVVVYKKLNKDVRYTVSKIDIIKGLIPLNSKHQNNIRLRLTS